MQLSVDVAYELLMCILKGLIDIYVPSDSGRRRNPWYLNQGTLH